VFLHIPHLRQYAGLVIISFAVTVALARWFFKFYRRRVLRLVGRPANAGDAVMEAPGLSQADEPDRGKDFPGIEALKLASGEQATRLARSLRIVALIFALVRVALSLALRWQAASSGPGACSEVSVEDAIVWSLVALTWTFLMPLRMELDEQGLTGYV
jgi:hypothetical protein